MYELIQLTDKSYYIQSPAKIGIYKTSETEVILIDSGNDKDAGRKIRQLLDANAWTLKAIYNTHSNADHIGGNKFLQDRYNCRIYASGIECDFTNHPVLEGAFLYGGYPPKDLAHKFILAQESKAESLTEAVLPEGFEIIPLPGHFFDMVGFRTPDDILFLADCLSSKETLDKYVIGFIYDVRAYLDTLERVKEMKARLFVPSHAEPTEDISELAQYNIDKVNSIADKIVKLCSEPVGFDRLLQKLFCEYNLTMTAQQHALVGSTVKSYLTYLCNENRLNMIIDDNIMKWHRA
ncbi:MAG: MBL fold metallo-hydrolase [Clostridia bacterium]|nr:MBL fold metallo-hydrolase [Clostridia bacterium]